MPAPWDYESASESADGSDPMLPQQASEGGRRRPCGARGAGLAAAGGLLAVWLLAQGRVGDPGASMRAGRSSAISLAKEECAARGEDCTSLKCCKEAGMQCYQKNTGWAECRPDCTEGLDLRGPDNSSWSCKELGDRTAGDIPPPCVGAFEDCSASLCCNITGFACYEKSKSDGSAFCRAQCTPGRRITNRPDGRRLAAVELQEARRREGRARRLGEEAVRAVGHQLH
ncbi:unnamed protein product [Prorocentrum cordatum]|uniref:Uncharacterized protein n=1 Tax=Prorocentrum cordatum TaxID=2364126 RepID=A0ABN9R2S1_9DINO|nr:unnamed protein product [Polarella glacialis]